jgi:hypothetical protein
MLPILLLLLLLLKMMIMVLAVGRHISTHGYARRVQEELTVSGWSVRHLCRAEEGCDSRRYVRV